MLYVITKGCIFQPRSTRNCWILEFLELKVAENVPRKPSEDDLKHTVTMNKLQTKRVREAIPTLFTKPIRSGNKL